MGGIVYLGEDKDGNIGLAVRKDKAMNIELVRLTGEYKEQLSEMLTEWKKMDILSNLDSVIQLRGQSDR